MSFAKCCLFLSIVLLGLPQSGCGSDDSSAKPPSKSKKDAGTSVTSDWGEPEAADGGPAHDSAPRPDAAPRKPDAAPQDPCPLQTLGPASTGCKPTTYPCLSAAKTQADWDACFAADPDCASCLDDSYAYCEIGKPGAPGRCAHSFGCYAGCVLSQCGTNPGETCVKTAQQGACAAQNKDFETCFDPDLADNQACYDQAYQTCTPACTPSCAGKSCGSDGCGGSCGTCATGKTCSSSGQCVSSCTPSCAGKSCGSDGCGGSCGTCSYGKTCSSSGQCVSGPTSCDPVDDIGCTGLQGCILLSSETATCIDVGAGRQGDSCSTTADCDGGHGCFALTCRKICLKSTGEGCSTGEVCNGVTGWTKYGACAEL